VTKAEMAAMMGAAVEIATRHGLQLCRIGEARVLHDTHCPCKDGDARERCICDPDIEFDALDPSGEACGICARPKKGGLDGEYEVVLLRAPVN
jgi:hypothetical protein